MSTYKSSKKSHASDVLSTKEAAVICKVALSTIVYWFDKGLIRGYRTPGGHRRIFRADLDKFMKDHQMPLGRRLPDGQIRVLVATQDQGLVEECSTSLGELDARADWTQARTGYDLGRMIGAFRPDVLWLDLRLPGVDAPTMCADLRADPETQHMEILVVGDPGEAPGIDALASEGACELMSRASDGNRLLSVVNRRLERV